MNSNGCQLYHNFGLTLIRNHQVDFNPQLIPCLGDLPRCC